MSATNGVLYPLLRNSFFILRRFSASFLLGAVMRTSSAPASIQRMDCSTVAMVSIVSVVVIVCTRIGWPAPKYKSPIFTSRVLSLEYFVRELQYICIRGQSYNKAAGPLPVLFGLVRS